MKKIMIFILCLVGALGKAQNRTTLENATTTIALKGGWLNSTIFGADKDILSANNKIDSYNAFMVGFSVDNAFNKYWGLKHELFYQNYGAKFEKQQDSQVFQADLRMHGIRVNPISVSYNVYGFQVYLGPYVNILLNSWVTALDEQGNKYKDHHIFGTSEDDQSNSDYLQKMDYGGVLGISYTFRSRFSLGIQYSRGFASLFDNSNSYENDQRANIKIYNSNFGVFLGYSL
ncbi:porin family protein [Myroides sp. LJL119]